MGNYLFNVLAVRADEPAQEHIVIPDPDLPPFPKEPLHQLDVRTLSQIVGGSLETQSQHADLLLASCQHHLYSTFEVLLIARQDGLEQWQIEIEFFRSIVQGPDVLGQTGSPKRKTRL